ncbi:MAG TPA: carboxypeptidase-like regulatory domain-containing protein [Thermoanaerobaculia bacterium]|nr:carboxypeptidase-like regulatory domain-containing protein [Thermoanaerobaculia bacterium]
MVPRVLAVATLLLLAATGAAAQETGPEDGLLVLSVELEGRLLAGDLVAFDHPEGILLPLGRLAELLELPLTVDPEGGRAQGWIAREERGASLDLERREWALGNRTGRFEPALAQILEGDLYLGTPLLSSWLAIDFAVDRGALSLSVSPRERLPLQERWEREESRLGLRAGGPEEGQPRFILEPYPYELAGWPTIDGSVRFALGTGEQGRTAELRPSLLARGDLLAMTAGLLVSGDEARLSLERALGGTAWRIGDVGVRPDPLVSRGHAGRGLVIDHDPDPNPVASSGRTTLAGDALPGWEVELYRDAILLDFQRIGEEGRYEFRDVPLQPGLNRFRLVSYGPRGERREEEERILSSADLPPAGATGWRLGIVQPGTGLLRDAAMVPSVRPDEARPGGLLGSFELERGVSRLLSWNLGLSSLALNEGRHDYLGLGLRTALPGGSGQLRFTRDLAGGWAGQLQARGTFGPLQVEADQVELRGFRADGEENRTLRSRTRIWLSTQAPPLPGRLFGGAGLPLSLLATRRVTAEGESLSLQAASSLSLFVGSSVVGNRWQVALADGSLSAAGSLLWSGRLRGAGLRGNLSYQLAPRPVLSDLTLQAETSLGRNLAGRLGLSQGLGESRTSLSAGLDWKRDGFLLGATLGVTSRGRVELGGALSFSLGRDPQAKRFRMRGAAGASQGAVSARVFLDADHDGRFGPGDTPLPGVRFESGSAMPAATTGKDGIAWIQVAPNHPVDLSIAEKSLADPAWVPARRGVSFVPRPGAARAVDFPLVVTGEIEGTVHLRRGDERSEASNVRVQLCDAAGEVVQEVRSQFDGFYLFERVAPGRYTIRVEPGQLERLRLTARIEAPAIELRSGELHRGAGIELLPNPL